MLRLSLSPEVFLLHSPHQCLRECLRKTESGKPGFLKHGKNKGLFHGGTIIIKTLCT